MKKQTLRAALMLALTFVLCSVGTSAQNGVIKLPPINVVPVIEWKSFQVVKGSDGNPYVGITFTVKNWKSYPDSLFAFASELPACGTNTNASVTWLDIYDFKTKKRIYGFCELEKAQGMESLSFNVKRETMPDCFYVTLTNRKTKKVVTSNPIGFSSGDAQCKEQQITIK